jgi:ribosomal protein L9
MATGSFYNPEEEFMKTLTQAMSSSEGESPVPEEAAIPQGRIGQLEALMAQQQNLSAQQAEAQARANQAALQTPRTGFRQEGGTWGQAFKDPSKAQANAMVSAGLALATSDPTKSLSQRIGMALGSGVNTLAQTRGEEQKRVAAGAQAEADRFGAEKEMGKDQFDMMTEVAKEERLRSGGASPSGISKLVRERNAAREAGDQELVDILNSKISKETQKEPVSFDPASLKIIGGELSALKEKADQAKKMDAESDRAEAALGSAFTGLAAGVKMDAFRVGKLFGLSGLSKEISATEALGQALGRNTLDLLSSGDLGSGTGLSDKDKEFAEKVTGGTIELSRENIEYAIDAKRRAANHYREKFNSASENYYNIYKERGSVPAYVEASFSRLYQTRPYTPISAETRAIMLRNMTTDELKAASKSK